MRKQELQNIIALEFAAERLKLRGALRLAEQLREGQLLIRLLLNSRRKLVAKRTLVRWINNHVAKQPANHWLQLLQQCIEEFCVAWSMDEIPSSQLLEWIF
ncbi:MAG: hypothetical protein Q8K61_04835 [Gallionella sp.]|nr:hypothetical protein [Gallionella sp.]